MTISLQHSVAEVTSWPRHKESVDERRRPLVTLWLGIQSHQTFFMFLVSLFACLFNKFSYLHPQAGPW